MSEHHRRTGSHDKIFFFILFLSPYFNKFFERTVVRPFRFGSKKTSGQFLIRRPVIGNAFAAETLAAARLIGAVALFFIPVLRAILNCHGSLDKVFHG